MYVCIYIYVYIYVFTCIYLYIYTYIHNDIQLKVSFPFIRAHARALFLSPPLSLAHVTEHLCHSRRMHRAMA